ncbi:MAG: serpin family protein [Polyangiaceae bacterium]|nr:serpin family protein [Polyangiaceae bacterium]
MRGWRTIIRMLPGLLVAGCAGTGTGNPMNHDAGRDSGIDSKPDAGTDSVRDSGSDDAGEDSIAQVKLLMSDTPRVASPDLDATRSESFGSDNRTFAFDLYQQLAEPDKNLFFSPYSISVALAMTYAGAENATESEMRTALHFSLPEPDLHAAFDATSRAIQGRSQELAPESTGDGFELSIVNQAWGQLDYPFLESYLDVLGAYYGTGLYGVDFANSEPVRLTINDWVAEQTNERIKNLLPGGSITPDVRLVLTNAIYFKASWLFEFDPAHTESGTFHAPGGDRTVSMMSQSVEASYAEGSNYQALELPYVSNAVRMLLILPAEGAFSEVAGSLGEIFFQQVRAALTSYSVVVRLPRFEFESEKPLKEPLSALGMSGAFAPGADFSGIAGGADPLWIFDVYHKAFVAVDEQGTEAAAATAVVMGTDSVKPVAETTFDRPFIFAIFDDPTGQILFLGQLADPG